MLGTESVFGTENVLGIECVGDRECVSNSFDILSTIKSLKLKQTTCLN